MSLNETYSDDNIFAKILRGEMPKVDVYEDDHTLAFMDVFPQSEGHTLVISKHAKSTNLLDLPADALYIELRDGNRPVDPFERFAEQKDR